MSLRGQRAAVLLYGYYPSDSRAERAAAAMASAGMEVHLICLYENPREPRREIVGGVHVRRVPLVHSRGSKAVYLWNYAAFFALGFGFLLRRGLSRRFDVVHVHNMPDFLVFAALVPRWQGARVLLDLHDPMPELMMSIYGLDGASRPVRILRWLERRSIAFASAVITTNIAFVKIFASRNPRPEKLHIVMNTPKADVFDPDRFGPHGAAPRTADGEFRLMHHGAIVRRHGIDLLVEALAIVRRHEPSVRLDIYGRHEPFLDEVLALARERGVADIIRYHGNKSEEEIVAALWETDLGVIPNRRSPFTTINFPTRIFEYLAMNRPVIAPATDGICDYFSPEELPLFEQDSVPALAERILWVRRNPAAAAAMLQRGRSVYRRHMWPEEKARLLALATGAAGGN